MFMEDKQWVWAQWCDVWCISAVATATWKTSHIPDSHAQLSHYKMKSISIRASTWIDRLQPGSCVQSWISASMRWKWWQHWNIAKFIPGESHKCSHRNRKNTICKYVRIYWTSTDWRWQFPGSHHYQRWNMVSSLYAWVKMAIHGVVTCEFATEEKVQDVALSRKSDVHCLLGQESSDPSGFPRTQTNHLLWPLHHDAD